MAEAVVDRLEVVEVHQQDRNGVAVARAACQRVLESVAEQGAVGETREPVVEGLVAQPLLQLLALADVPDVEHDPVPQLVVEQAGCASLAGADRAVAVKQAQLSGRTAAVGRGAEPQQRGDVLGVHPLVSLWPSSSEGR